MKRAFAAVLSEKRGTTARAWRVWCFVLLAVWPCLSASAELGKDWRQATATAPWYFRSGHTSVVFNNKIWVIGGVGGDNDVWSSLDGTFWRQATSHAPWGHRYDHASVVYNGKIWVIGGDDGDLGGARNDVWYSSDGAKWTSATLSARWSPRSGHTSVVFSGKIWVMGGYAGGVAKNDVWYSSDGSHWTSATLAAPWQGRSGHTSVVFNGKMWVIGGGYFDWDNGGSQVLNDAWCSSDGVHWTSATLSAPWIARSGHTSVVHNGKIWLLGGENVSTPTRTPIYNDTWYSSDGVHWTSATLSAPWPGRCRHSSVVYSQKMWVIGGEEGGMFDRKNDVWSSADGVNWTQATHPANWPGRAGHSAVTFSGRMWVLGGYTGETFDDPTNDVWWSLDGARWTSATLSAPWPVREGHTSVVHNGRMWVIGGATNYHPYSPRNDAWWSLDGVRWTSATVAMPWRPRGWHSSVVFAGKMWVIGGYSGFMHAENDVWCSSDGVRWSSATLSAPWSPRYGHTSVVHNGKMWVIGGYHPEIPTYLTNWLNDVWYSTDGIKWTSATLSAPWTGRYNHTSVAYDGRIWVMGGSPFSPVIMSDVWYSWDGAKWKCATLSAPWFPRFLHASVVFDNKIWVMGGLSIDFPSGDVWYSATGTAASTWRQYR
jgi:hypothetical protein